MSKAGWVLKPLAAAIVSIGFASHADAVPEAVPPQATAASAIARPAVALRSTSDWIQFDDDTFMPVTDEASRHLAAAGVAFNAKDDAKAATELRATADALQEQMTAAAGESTKKRAPLRLAADKRVGHAIARLRAIATSVAQGKIKTRAQFDSEFSPTLRADLDSRWFDADYSTWYPISAEPHRQFEAAMVAFVKQDRKAAATEIRRGIAYLQLEKARSTGQAQYALDRSIEDLSRSAHSVSSGSGHDEHALKRDFARADNALARSHHEQAVHFSSEGQPNAAGYALKAGAEDLSNASAWIGQEADTAANDMAHDVRRSGDQLASGAGSTQAEVDKALHTLEAGIQQLSHAIDTDAHRAANKVTPS